MQTIKASEFKATCLQLMDIVQSSGEEIIITKNGKPVSRLVPYVKKADTLFGLHQKDVKSGDKEIFSTGEHWNVNG